MHTSLEHFEAGAGTTAAAMMSFILAMVLHPSALRSLQQEIDAVVGDDRLPTFDDMLNLPHVRATVKETLRWRPVTAGGVPHQLTQDDTYILDGKKYLSKQGLTSTPINGPFIETLLFILPQKNLFLNDGTYSHPSYPAFLSIPHIHHFPLPMSKMLICDFSMPGLALHIPRSKNHWIHIRICRILARLDLGEGFVLG